MRELTSQNEKNPTNPKKKTPQTKHTPAWASVAIRNVIVNDHSLVPNRGRRRSATVNSCPAATENIMTISLLFLLPVEQQKSRVEDYLDLEVLSTPPHFHAQFLKRSAPFPCPPPPKVQHSARPCQHGTFTALTLVNSCSSVAPPPSHAWDQISVKMHSISLIQLDGYRTALRHSVEVKYQPEGAAPIELTFTWNIFL